MTMMSFIGKLFLVLPVICNGWIPVNATGRERENCIVQTNVFGTWEDVCKCVLIGRRIVLLNDVDCVEVKQPEDYRVSIGNSEYSNVEVVIADSERFTLLVVQNLLPYKNSGCSKADYLENISKKEVHDVLKTASTYLNMSLSALECEIEHCWKGAGSCNVTM
ncbi:hypothetical protein ACFFRR_007095 [Megaselia abdita]